MIIDTIIELLNCYIIKWLNNPYKLSHTSSDE